MPDDLRITLLGPLTLARGGRALPESIWRSRQERRLLCMLITARGARVPAERLIEQLWPKADRVAAAISLRSAISSLRRTLEPDGEARASAHYILTGPSGYAWNRSSGAWIDAEVFLALTAGDRQPAPILYPGKGTDDDLSSTPTRIARGQELQEAISLYRGDYLE